MPCRYRLTVLALALVFGLPAAARAVVFVNDTWIDDTDSDPASPAYSENGVDVDMDGDIESAWFRGNVGTLDPVPGAPAGPLRGDLTGTGSSSASWTTYFTPEGSEANLADGDTLQLTWKFQLTGINASNTSQGFRFALVDADTRLTAASGSPPSAIYAGYAIYANMGQTLGNSGPFQLRERTLATAGNLLNSTGDFGTTLGNGATNGATGFAADTPYTLIWKMTRMGTDLAIDVSIAGGTLDADGIEQVQFTDTTPNSFKYDTFALRPTSEVTTASQFDTSLFKVELLPAGGGSENANFDGVGVTDGNDYLIWQRGLGAAGTGTLATGDANADTNVNGADLGIWRNKFGSAAVAAAGAVPEPTSLACGLLAVLGASVVRHRR